MPIDVGTTSLGLPVLLVDTNGDPVTGVAYDAAGLAVTYRKPGGAATPIVLTADNWHEQGGGAYEVDQPADLYDTAGYLYYWAECADCKTYPGALLVKQSIADQLSGVDVTVVSPTTESGDVAVKRGATYAATTRQITFNVTGWPDLTDGTVQFNCAGLHITAEKTTVGPDITQVFTISLTEAQTVALSAGAMPYSLVAFTAAGLLRPDDIEGVCNISDIAAFDADTDLGS